MLSDGRRSGREQVNRRRRIANALLPLDHAIDEKTRGSVAFRPQRTRSHDVDKSVSPFCPATAERCDPHRSAAARQPRRLFSEQLYEGSSQPAVRGIVMEAVMPINLDIVGTQRHRCAQYLDRHE